MRMKRSKSQMLQIETAMSSSASGSWLFLLFNLPAKQSSDRVKFWRRLKKFGTLQLKSSTYVLPDEPVHYERFQWLGKESLGTGGETTVVRGKASEGLADAGVTPLFKDARSRAAETVRERLTLAV